MLRSLTSFFSTRATSKQRAPLGVNGFCRRATIIVALLGSLLSVGTASAAGAGQAPAWTLTSMTTPTNFTPGGVEEAYVVTATNTGDAPAEGAAAPILVTDALPPGIKVGPGGVSAVDQRTNASITCEAAPIRCSSEESILPGDALVLTINVEVEPGAEGTSENLATVSGGEASTVSSSDATTVSTVPAGFGVEPSSLAMETSTSQAGAHADFTTTFALNQASPDHPPANLKSIEVNTPPGLIGDPTAVPTCTMNQVNTGTCPQDAAVGVAAVGTEFGAGTIEHYGEFVYNLQPYATEPAALAFVVNGEIPVRLDFSVRSDGDYGLRATATGLTDFKSIVSTTLTLWGVPADHNGPGPFSFFDESNQSEAFYGGPGSGARRPFLRNPTICAGSPLLAGLKVESWEEPGFAPLFNTSLAPFTGCEHLVFAPSVAISSETSQSGAPSSYTVDVHVPQPEDPDGLGTPDLKNAVVTLPPGTVISPSAANGLEGCSDSPASAQGDQFALDSLAPASCPHGSQVGTVQISTPLLAHPLEGQVFLGVPECAPCSPADAQEGRMIRLFVQAQGSGVIVKLEGRTSVNQATGQLTTTFDNDPQLPFEDFTIKLTGGARAPLANPLTCGTPAGATELTPYSSTAAFISSTSAIEVNGCSPPAFTPTFSAGTTSNQAGAFSPEMVSFSRPDRQEDFGTISLTEPPGVLAMLSQVPRCSEADAQAGTCAAASQIGTTTVAAGPGSEPFYLSGAAFLTGPYGGGPFGLAFVVHAVAGPYDLGNVIVRAAITVNQLTGAVTIKSNSLPQTIDGIPLRLRALTVDINREKFAFNATSCEPMSFSGTISSALGATAPVSSRFQAANCANLPFKPTLSATTQANGTTRGNGASLDVKIQAKQGPGFKAGEEEANIAKVDVSLPHALSSRLTTLQKACGEAQFAANPAGCPKESDVGMATASTPILANPLTGPAYLVSHGGEAFPDLDLVLQGEGVEIVLTGHTQIKKGITYSHFETVPDAPIGSFNLELPEKQFSILAAIENLCDTNLQMPTEITGQNGAVEKGSTRIATEGCSGSFSVVSKKAKNGTLTLSVYAPGAGKVTTRGKGVSNGIKTYSGKEALTFKIKQNKQGKLKTKIKLTFTPSGKGKKQFKNLTVEFKR